MKTLQLTDEEIKTILNALNYVGNKYLDQVAQLVRLDRTESNKELLDRAEKYHALASSIENSEKDLKK